MEKIRRDSGRVDVDKLNPWDSNDPEISGGYMLSIDKVGSGDLPAGIQVLDDFSGGSDEGRGMMQLIYDVAPGVDMARAAGVDVAAAAWAHNIPLIRDYMQQHCVATFDEVADFAEFVLR